jgi:ATP-dependent Lon protease
MSNKLNKIEILVAELTWGGVPTDINWIRNSNLFKEKMVEFEEKVELLAYMQAVINHLDVVLELNNTEGKIYSWLLEAIKKHNNDYNLYEKIKEIEQNSKNKL